MVSTGFIPIAPAALLRPKPLSNCVCRMVYTLFEVVKPPKWTHFGWPAMTNQGPSRERPTRRAAPSGQLARSDVLREARAAVTIGSMRCAAQISRIRSGCSPLAPPPPCLILDIRTSHWFYAGGQAAPGPAGRMRRTPHIGLLAHVRRPRTI